MGLEAIPNRSKKHPLANRMRGKCWGRWCFRRQLAEHVEEAWRLPQEDQNEESLPLWCSAHFQLKRKLGFNANPKSPLSFFILSTTNTSFIWRKKSTCHGKARTKVIFTQIQSPVGNNQMFLKVLGIGIWPFWQAVWHVATHKGCRAA